ncbi:hypothetical protein CQ14_16640 [Bradyrhizobium lablabi]|uniref:BioF2-like acetyltransferase domain-containing protein n=2 Tax=Bradyrhizobium lablabi TaxID=722472 RepID=A0A0R3M9D2_9BRAD|nr:hypothetical protein CQ14_16640 [Bradyrhizobium lablabi]
MAAGRLRRRNRKAMSEPQGNVSAVEVDIYTELRTAERWWTEFERRAECTVFQKFAWLAAWHNNIGRHQGSTPVIVLGRDPNGKVQFILPLAIERRGATGRLTWLGAELCDYNAPLLGQNFANGLRTQDFCGLWRAVIGLIRANPDLRFDMIDLDRMPERIGSQRNPFLDLAVLPRTYGAHFATLGLDWNKFFLSKRSSATRKRERRQFRHLAEHGEIRFVQVTRSDEIERSMNLLIEQKRRSFARMQVEDIFDRPGYLAFFHDVATDPRLRDVVHVSRLDVGDSKIATGLGLRHKNCYSLILSSYEDSALARYGPGRAHLQHMLRYAIEHGFELFDMTIGDEPYKLDWCDIEMKLFGYYEATTLKGRAIVAVKMAIDHAKPLITRMPPPVRRLARSVHRLSKY